MKIKIGAIIEIPTAKGLAYAQYTHKHEDFGYLIHVIKGFYTEIPHDLESLACQPHSIRTFFPLGVAVRRKIFKIIGHASVPERAQIFPIFKSPMRDYKANKVISWSLWDGENSWRVSRLTEEEKDYPNRLISNDTFLIERIEEEWTDRGREEDYNCCDARRNVAMVRHEHILKLNEKEAIVVESNSCCKEDKDNCYSVWFQSEGGHIKRSLSLSEDNPLGLFKDLLIKALNNTLQLPKSLKSTPGVIWNDLENCAKFNTLDENEKNKSFWKPYLWQSSRFFSEFNVWIYNDPEGAIVFEITPVLKQLYYKNGPNKEMPLLYEEWKDYFYRPYARSIISAEIASKLITQIGYME